MAEFLRGWRAVPPNTYFNRVKHVGAATRTTIDLAKGVISSEEYWRPFEDEFYPSIDAAADALATAVETAIQERTDFAARPVFMVSGGADSRVLLFSTANRSKVTGVNLYERLADETAVAKELCQLAGTKFVALQRDRDFYPRLLPEIVRWSGGMWSAEDSHYYGFGDKLADLGADLLMTACTTDWVFKGYGLEKAYLKLGGKNLPFNQFTKVREEGFLPNHPSPAPPELAEKLKARMDHWFAGCPDKLETPRDFLKVEDRRIRPACYTVSVSGQIMARCSPYDTFLADSRVAECYSRIHPAWKLNREVWGKAVARICIEAGKVVDSNYGWPVDATMPQKALRFATGWVHRRLDRLGRSSLPTIGDDERAPSSGSWPDYGWYARNSPSLKLLWEEASTEHRDRLRQVAGDDPWSNPLADLGRDGHRLMRYSTLLAHWGEIEARKKRAISSTMVWRTKTQDR
jgi:asparagine synthase (glutamine-hydrolysing)